MNGLAKVTHLLRSLAGSRAGGRAGVGGAPRTRARNPGRLWGKWRPRGGRGGALRVDSPRVRRAPPRSLGPRLLPHHAQGLGFSALFPARPSTLIKARQAG